MNPSGIKNFLWNGASQNFPYSFLHRLIQSATGSEARLYCRSSLKPELTWHKHSQEAESDGSKSDDKFVQIGKSHASINTFLLYQTVNHDSRETTKNSSDATNRDTHTSQSMHHSPEGFNKNVATQACSPELDQLQPYASGSHSVSLFSSDEPPGPATGSEDGPDPCWDRGDHHDPGSDRGDPYLYRGEPSLCCDDPRSDCGDSCDPCSDCSDPCSDRGDSCSDRGDPCSDRGDPQWEVAGDGRPPIAWDPDVAAECDRSTLLTAPLPPPAVPERHRQADPASDAELRQLASVGQLSAALRSASALSAAGTPPSFATLSLLADEAARRVDPTSFERVRRLAARLYPVNYGRAARLRASQLELLWRRRLFAPACGLLLRYRAEPIRRQLMARRFAVCCCLAAQEEVEDALPHIQRTAAALMNRGHCEPLLSAWQHCMLSERHSFQEAGRQLLLRQPAARRQLTPHLLHVLQEAQLTGREDVLRHLLELVLRLGETRLYPLVFGALLDFQCLVEDVRSARETFKLVGEMSISLPSAVINRYSSLLQRHRLKAPAALLRMKYRQRPPDCSAAPQVPSAPDWWDKW